VQRIFEHIVNHHHNFICNSDGNEQRIQQVVANNSISLLMNVSWYSTRDPMSFARQNESVIADKRVCVEYRHLLITEITQLSSSDFRRQHADIGLACYITDFAIQLLDKECYYGVLCLLIVTDMIDVLLQVEYIARREMNFSPGRMKRVQSIVATILSRDQYNTYIHCVRDMKLPIAKEWRNMLIRMKNDEPLIVCEQIATRKEAHDEHQSKYHGYSDDSLFCRHEGHHRLQLYDHGASEAIRWFYTEETTYDS